MAEPVNDFSFDPYQVEEQSLNERLKQAMLKQLRQSSGNSWDIVGAGQVAFDRMQGAREEQNVYNRRRQMADAYDRSLMDATQGVDPQIRDLMMSPATRGVGLERLREALKRKSDDEEMTKLRQQFQGGGALPGATGAQSGIPSYEEVVAMSLHPNPTIAARGKRLEELYYKPQDPKNNIYAGGRPVPGADAAYGRTQGALAQVKAEHEIIEVPDGRGGTVRMPKAQYLQMMQGQSPGVGAPPTGMPPGVGTGAAPAPNGPVSAPIPPVSGPPPGPSALPGATGTRAGLDQALGTQGGRYSPEQMASADQRRLAILYQELKNNPNPSDQAAITREIQLTTQKLAKLSPIGSAQAATLQAPPPQGLVRPTAPFGHTPDPTTTKIYDKQMEGREGGFQKFQEKGSEVPETRAVLDKMKNVGTTYTGIQAIPMAVESFSSMFTGGKSERGRNTEEFNKYSSDLRASIIKQYGTGNSISDADLKATLDRIPNADQDPRTRAKLIAGIEEDMDRFEWVAPRVRAYVEQGVPLAEAQNAANRDYRSLRAQGAPQQNPTQAGGEQRALPSATRAALPSEDNGPGPWYLGLGDNIANVAKAPFSSEGWKGFGAAQMNVLRGAGQALGVYSGDEWKADKAEQELRSRDPQYAAGLNFGTVFNPTAVIGGGSTSVPKLAAAGATQAFLAPAESGADKAWNAVGGGAFGTLVGSFGRLFPTISSSVPDLKQYLDKFSSVRPTSAQLNPDNFDSALARALGLNTAAALGQIKALTADLMKKGGLEGNTITEEVINRGRKSLAAEFNKLFPDTKNAVGTVMGTQEQAALRQQFDTLQKARPDVMKMMNDGNAPALTRLYKTLTDVQNPIKINPKDLHEAWKEVGLVAKDPQAAAGVRQTIEALVEKGMSPDTLKLFKELNYKWGTVEDIDRIFKMAGTGEGAASGYLAPSKIEAQAGKGPQFGATDEAAQLVRKMRLKDYEEPMVSVQGPGEFAWSGVRAATGKGLAAVDKIIQSLPAKKVSEMLRNWGIAGSQAITREQAGD